MSDDMVMIRFSWESGPFGTFSASDREVPEIDPPSGYGTNLVPIPRSAWDAYLAARDALDEAEADLSEWEEKALAPLRAADPRWTAELERRAEIRKRRRQKPEATS